MLTVKTVKTLEGNTITLHQCDFVIADRTEHPGENFSLIYLKRHKSDAEDVEICLSLVPGPNNYQHVFVMNETGKTVEAFHAD